ncbi:hypothetical protein LZZ90_08345 [Flavobacterium sp. SM15]|uniref:hypothetical protein n=1 Tax=Flavobacterium sp. SM15 TaxID=2908005 RepID=UPI001EDC8CC6|nr:hypothetical protein [Flavobacterium sp. SM15]MCG2611516.1 hypothetical protein [Flavobacterium sp. SM15]
MIIITSNLLTNSFNPAYNDSIITFHSTLTGTTLAEISVVPSGNTFTVYPYNNEFRYNFKDLVKTMINPNGFADSIIPNLNGSLYIIDDNSLQLVFQPSITTYTETSGDTVSLNYKFLKSAEQLIGYKRKIDNDNSVRILLPTVNNQDYNLTYHEGYPKDFAIAGINSGDTYYFKNTNSGAVTQTFTGTTNEVKRIYLSDGSTNLTIVDELSISSNINNIELWVNGVFNSNIRVKKLESQCGVLLKWFNQNGGYSYWLFEKFYKESLKTKDLDDINGSWDNLQNVTFITNSLGKMANKALQLSSSYDQQEKEYLLDLMKSPKVEMYIHNNPFNQFLEGDFIGVKVSDGSTSFENKSQKNKIKITVELPPENTITY